MRRFPYALPVSGEAAGVVSIARIERPQRIAGCHPLSFCFRRRPIQFSVPAAVEAGEAVAGFASGIRHGGEGDGGIVEGACRLIVEEMHFGHHRDRGAVPWWGWLFFAGNLLLRMTLFAFGFIHLDTGEMGGVVGNVHRSAASGLETSEMFVL